MSNSTNLTYREQNSMNFRYITISLLFVFLPTMLIGQIDTLRLNKHYLGKYWSDTKRIVTAPAHWDKRDWTKFAIYTGATASLLFVDEQIDEAFQTTHLYAGETGENISANFFEPFGAKYTLITTGAFFTYGLLANDGRSRSTGLLALESFILSSAFVRLPKYLFGRNRPDSGVGVTPFDFEGPGGGQSFPSGHTIAVFSVASVIANQYADTKWVPVASYTIAGLAGLSRIYDGKHWASDVLMSAVLGTLIGNMVCQKEKHHGISIVPYQTNSIKGIKLALTL